MGWSFRVSNPYRDKRLLSETPRAALCSPLSSNSNGIGVFLAGEAPRREVKHSSPSVPRSKMSGSKPLLLLYDLMVGTGTVASLPGEVKHTFLSLNESGRCVNHV